MNDEQKKRWEELEQEINKIDEYLDSEEFKTATNKDKEEIIRLYLVLAYEQNEIKKYPLKKRMKLKMIKDTMEGVEALLQLKVKNHARYLILKEKITQKINKVVKNAKRKN
jgi:predicted nuclease with TOPRIM domain